MLIKEIPITWKNSETTENQWMFKDNKLSALELISADIQRR